MPQRSPSGNNSGKSVRILSYITPSNYNNTTFLLSCFVCYREICNNIQREKFRILKRSKIFKGWSTDAIVRLARLAKMVVIPRNVEVVKQGEKVEHVHFIYKGICTVSKFPDRCNQLERTKLKLLRELDFNRTKYAYHRSMHSTRSDLSKKWGRLGSSTPLRRSQKSSNSGKDRVTLARGEVKIDGGKGVYISENHVTAGERHQDELERKIQECNRLIAKYSKEDKGVAMEAKELESLVAPSFFGVECLLDPENGMGMGTVKANTVVHALCLHKVLFQAFDVNDTFIERVKKRSVRYPDDLALARSIEDSRGWDEYKEAQMLNIKKTKWPMDALVKELPGGQSVIVEAIDKKGDMLSGGMFYSR